MSVEWIIITTVSGSTIATYKLHQKWKEKNIVKHSIWELVGDLLRSEGHIYKVAPKQYKRHLNSGVATQGHAGTRALATSGRATATS